jgi:hypothetical protein
MKEGFFFKEDLTILLNVNNRNKHSQINFKLLEWNSCTICFIKLSVYNI